MAMFGFPLSTPNMEYKLVGNLAGDKVKDWDRSKELTGDC